MDALSTPYQQRSQPRQRKFVGWTHWQRFARLLDGFWTVVTEREAAEVLGSGRLDSWKGGDLRRERNQREGDGAGEDVCVHS
jgi:hypothetical protein